MKYLLLTLSYLICLTAQGQDLILTIEGDSINAKITKEKKDFLYFTFKHQDEVRHTLLPYSQVQAYVYDYFEQPEVLPEQIRAPDDYPHWRWAVQGGYGRRLAKINDQVPASQQEHLRRLKSGFNLATDLVYFLSETVGVGGKYTFFRTASRIEDIDMGINDMGINDMGINSSRRVSIDEQNTIQYIGPTLAFRAIAAPSGNRVLSSFSLGYLHYGSSFSGGDVRITGHTLGLCLDLGYDLVLSKHLLLGFQLALTGGVITQIELDDGFRQQTIELEEDSYEGLGRIDLSVGLRFSR